ncbi:conserved hypothetical protein [Ricinus communis]|uniref:Uncharacterized protein n=1 Tax=Ricinus communis TaxID=3988 RepID=B9SBW1_RICCO|nr:conserved hypothetical protein [Ricinus communis]
MFCLPGIGDPLIQQFVRASFTNLLYRIELFPTSATTSEQDMATWPWDTRTELYFLWTRVGNAELTEPLVELDEVEMHMGRWNK